MTVIKRYLSKKLRYFMYFENLSLIFLLNFSESGSLQGKYYKNVLNMEMFFLPIFY